MLKFWDRLNRLAAREVGEIDMLFIKHGIGAWVDRGRIVASPTGNFVRYYLHAADKVTRVESVEKDLSVLLSRLRKQPLTVNVRVPGLYIELPYPLATRPLAWADVNLGALGKFEMIIGRDYSGATPRPVTLDFKDRSVAHMLVSGVTGSGKTNALISAILSLCWSTSPADAQVIILDPKFSAEMLPLADLPHVSLYQETQDCADAIASVKAEMNRRKRGPSTRRIFLVVEELAELMIEVGSTKTTLFEQLKSLTGIGRGLGVHVIACTQRASVDVIDPVMRANLPIRLAGKVSTVEESRIATGLSDAGCETLPGNGSFQYVRNGVAHRLQSHFVADGEALSIAYQIAGKWGGVRPYQIEMMGGDNSPGEADDIATYVATVLKNVGIEDIFDANGKPARGIKARIVRVLFGENAGTGGHNDRVAGAVLERIRNTTTTSEESD